jgi:hypothetical protein
VAHTTYSFPVTSITKSSPKTLTVSGLATNGTLDRDMQRISEPWAREALKSWLAEGGTLRQQHDARKPIGKGVSIGPDGLTVTSVVIAKGARRLTLASVLRSYSVGISNPKIISDPSAPGGLIVDGVITELSLCDTPSNPSCKITIAKAAADGRAVFVGEITKGKKRGKRLALKNHKNICLGCGRDPGGDGLDRGERFCPDCGRQNPLWSPLADAQLPMNQDAEKGAHMSKRQRKALKAALRAEKSLQSAILTKAAGAPWPITSAYQAETHILMQWARDPDRAWANAAEEVLRQRVA